MRIRSHQDYSQGVWVQFPFFSILRQGHKAPSTSRTTPNSSCAVQAMPCRSLLPNITCRLHHVNGLVVVILLSFASTGRATRITCRTQAVCSKTSSSSTQLVIHGAPVQVGTHPIQHFQHCMCPARRVAGNVALPVKMDKRLYMVLLKSLLRFLASGFTRNVDSRSDVFCQWTSLRLVRLFIQVFKQDPWKGPFFPQPYLTHL